MDRSKLNPELRKIYEDLDTLDFKVSMAREAPGMYSDEEVEQMAGDLPQRLREVADELQRRFYALPADMQRRIRHDVHHKRDMTDVREWIEHMNENFDWLGGKVQEGLAQAAQHAIDAGDAIDTADAHDAPNGQAPDSGDAQPDGGGSQTRGEGD